jgi:PAS domain S-box-containing protein
MQQHDDMIDRLQESIDALTALTATQRRTIDSLREAQAELETRLDERTSQLATRTVRFDQLFEQVPEGVVLLDADDRVVCINSEFTRLFGYAPDEATGHLLNDLVRPEGVEDQASPTTVRMRHIQGRVSFDAVCRAKHGNLVHVSVLGVPVDVALADVKGLAIYRDITDRVRAERARQQADEARAAKARRKSEVFFSEGQRLSHTGSWAYIVATDELVWSEEHCRLLGYDPATTKPTLDLFWQRVHPEDLPGMQQDFARALQQKRGVDREFRVVLPDGTTKYLHGMDQAVVDETGRLIEFVGTTMDVSDRKQAEAALDAARAELARVTRTTTMGELAASIAHEVNQPLAAVVANANACHRWLAREVPDVLQARAAAQRVIKDGKRAGDVIAGIRSLFKQSPMELGPVDMAQAIREVLDAIRPELVRQRIQVRTSLPGDLPRVQGDGVQLQQVVLNLITNAIQAMSGVPDRARDLVIGVSRGDLDGAPGLLVRVQDTGVGFEPEQEGKLFEAFYTTKSDGLGMGLGISRSIIDALGGRLWASPNPDRGATFQFVLPVSSS